MQNNRIAPLQKLGTLNGNRSLKNALRRRERYDFYQFSLAGRSNFSVQMTGLKNNANLELLNQNRNRIAASRKPGKRPETLTAQLEAGVYHLRVVRRGGDTAYRLRLAASAVAIPQPSIGLLSTGSAELGQVDRATGNLTLNNTSLTFTDIARSNTGELFGITTSRLYKVDANTGATSLIGDLGTSNMNALGFSDAGTLYAAGGSGFYTVNTQTGAATLIANISNFFSSGDLAFDPFGNRFLATSATFGSATDTLYAIGLDGAATAVGDTGFSNLFGLAQANGTFYGYTVNRLQIRIDPATGIGTFDRALTGTTSAIYGAA
jgi:Bacterial pre-peptidase C-terminal domain/SMP-30/Gluconolactonase/LRE-like region